MLKRISDEVKLIRDKASKKLDALLCLKTKEKITLI